MRPLTDQESAVLERILAGDGIGLVQASYNGEQTAVIAEFATDADGNVTHVSPLAVLLNEGLSDLVIPDRDYVRRPLASLSYEQESALREAGQEHMNKINYPGSS